MFRNACVLTRRLVLQLLSRPLILDDLTRFQSVYAHRIRKLDLFRNGTDNELVVHLLRSLQEMHVGLADSQILLLAPRLTTLSWYSLIHPSYASIFRSVLHFLSPRLNYIQLHVSLEDDTHQDLIFSLGDRYPALESFRITYAPNEQHPEGRQWITFEPASHSHFQNLRYLGIPHLTDEGLELVSQLPKLTHLNISDFLYIPPPEPSHQPSTAYTAFPSLQSLFGVTVDMDNAFGLIQRIPPSAPLTSLWLAFTPRSGEAHTLAQWQTLLDLVHQHCNHATLEILSLQESDFYEPEETLLPPVGPIAGDIEALNLSPLFAFTSLSSLRLSVAHNLALTPKDLRSMAESWKSVKLLELSPKYPSYKHPAINHEDVIHLVRDLPKLTTLGIIFDAQNIPSPAPLLNPKAIKRFQSLSVGNSPLGSVNAAVDILKLHFPRLAEVNACNHPTVPSTAVALEWAKVGLELISSIIARRKARADAAAARRAGLHQE